MKISAVLMAMILASAPAAQATQPVVVVSTAEASDVPLIDGTTALAPFVISAPRLPWEDIKVLKEARNASAGVAAAGAGLMAYSVFFAAGGPIGWAAAIIWLGATGAYLSHRKIQGHDDFSPTAATPKDLEESKPPEVNDDLRPGYYSPSPGK